MVIITPVANDLPDVFQTHNPVHIQAFIPELTIEAFNVDNIGRSVRSIKHQFHFITIEPVIKNLADELGAVINRYHFRHSIEPEKPVQNATDRLPVIEVSTSKPGGRFFMASESVLRLMSFRPR